jgi:hypothetical protein
LADAVLFFVKVAVLGLPASAFLGAAVFLLAAGLGPGFVVAFAFLAGALPTVDLEGGLEFWGITRVGINVNTHINSSPLLSHQRL